MVARSIVDEITDRGYAPGTKLPPERDMVERYGVGRGTLRESLRFLELTGVIVMRAGPGGGPIVAAPDAQDFAGLLGLFLQLNPTPFGAVIQARQVLEPAIAGLAARNATPELLQVLADNIESMERFIDDEQSFLIDNDQFHEAVATAAGNPLFSLLTASLHRITDGMTLGVDYPLSRRKAVLAAHRRIYEAVERRDAEAAEAAMYQHMDEFRKYVKKTFPKVQDRFLRWTDIAP
ncbi:FadR/GntR family transcriptional regulator [Streptomyces sp. NPDC057137]|uniref:FadR/GntR family transcriptional regulator n=1 Tax=Streptomyces sp. NPDC057137 TaxID=3346030 RepID=UPI0036301EFE